MGKTLIAWSGGKDSAWTLQRLRGAPGIQIAGLFTTVDADDGSVAVHAVRRSLLDAQVQATGLPLYTVAVPARCSNAIYEAAMAGFVESAMLDGVTQLAFGDLFLEDIRRYRERQFAKSGLELLFPLWGEPTRALAEEMVEGGLRARIVCVDLAQAPREWAGKTYDPGFVARIPEGIDPCGERGEFHTFAYAGPMFHGPLATRVAETSERDGYVYADLAAA